jgi:hypothetical protein
LLAARLWKWRCRAEIWKAVMDKAHEGLGVEPLAGTELDMAYLQKASDALGISGVPAHNPFRPRIPSMEDRKKLADIEADHREIARNR